MRRTEVQFPHSDEWCAGSRREGRPEGGEGQGGRGTRMPARAPLRHNS